MERIHYVPQYFMNPTHPITIAVIGCGGTGSLVVARLARLDYVLQKLGHPGLHVTVFDPDIVEENNVGRQGFLKNDIGEFKANNVIEKINRGFGTLWEAYAEKVEKNHFPFANIIMTCVDNAELRMDMAKDVARIKSPSYRFDYKEPVYWIDCGNGKDFGQVVMTTIKPVKQPEKSIYECISNLPNVVDIYGDLAKYDTEEVQRIEGCSMAESLEKQDLFINDEIAVQAVKIVQYLTRNNFIKYHGVVINQKSCKVVPIMVPAEKVVKEKKPVKRKKQKA